MKRVAIGLALTLVLCAAAAGAVAKTNALAGTSSAKATTLTVWVGWSQRELKEFKKITSEYDSKHPDVNVKVVGGINDDKITAAIRSGNVPDVVSSFTSANVGSYCKSGAWVDLKPFLSKDHLDVNVFPKTSQYYTQYNGKRCALPFLADVYGFYYNKKMFQAAGIKSPPKTMSELTADAKKLTKRSQNGSLKVVGYNPFLGFYAGNAPDLSAYAPLFGAKYTDAAGHYALSKDPAWSRLLKWQKNLVDWYGYKNLQKFDAGAADEFSASHAFEIGKVAMMIDGEWRVACIQAEHPGLAYATAPAPVDDAKPSLYGAGYVNGTIIGIPKGVKHKDQAWALLKYLTFNAHPLALFSNAIRNVPTTKESLHSREIKPDARFATFLTIFKNLDGKNS